MDGISETIKGVKGFVASKGIVTVGLHGWLIVKLSIDSMYAGVTPTDPKTVSPFCSSNKLTAPDQVVMIAVLPQAPPTMAPERSHRKLLQFLGYHRREILIGILIIIN